MRPCDRHAEGISRHTLDELAVESQERASIAIRGGYFKKRLVPVSNEDGSLAQDREESPRTQMTLEGLAALRPAFGAIAEFPLDEQGTTYGTVIRQVYPDLKITPVHHVGNSSVVVDGAAAILLASAECEEEDRTEAACACCRDCKCWRCARR